MVGPGTNVAPSLQQGSQVVHSGPQAGTGGIATVCVCRRRQPQPTELATNRANSPIFSEFFMVLFLIGGGRIGRRGGTVEQRCKSTDGAIPMQTYPLHCAWQTKREDQQRNSLPLRHFDRRYRQRFLDRRILPRRRPFPRWKTLDKTVRWYYPASC